MAMKAIETTRSDQGKGRKMGVLERQFEKCMWNFEIAPEEKRQVEQKQKIEKFSGHEGEIS